MPDLTLGPVTVDTDDIDLDITGVTITVTVLDRTFLIRGSGGEGWWIDSDTGRHVEVAKVTDLEFAATIQSIPDKTWRVLRDRLVAWAETRQPIRWVALPGRTILCDGKRIVPLPRRDYPQPEGQ